MKDIAVNLAIVALLLFNVAQQEGSHVVRLALTAHAHHASTQFALLNYELEKLIQRMIRVTNDKNGLFASTLSIPPQISIVKQEFNNFDANECFASSRWALYERQATCESEFERLVLRFIKFEIGR